MKLSDYNSILATTISRKQLDEDIKNIEMVLYVDDDRIYKRDQDTFYSFPTDLLDVELDDDEPASDAEDPEVSDEMLEVLKTRYKIDDVADCVT
jgi:hypothetical protein